VCGAVTRELTPLNGYVHVKVWEKQADGTEKIVKDDVIKNIVVTVGKDAIMKYIGRIQEVGYANEIGVGDSTTAAAVGQSDLQASSNYLWKTIQPADRIFLTPTLYLSVDFGYNEANFTWNELAIRDNQLSPNETVIVYIGSTLTSRATPDPIMWARQIDATPLVKTTSKRAIVEWQLAL
jgi:hypothetical protein